LEEKKDEAKIFELENSSEYIMERWCTDTMAREATKKIKLKVCLENEDIPASFEVVLVENEL
jgi:hypothetical protein